MIPRRWFEYLLAILLGNLLYFSLMPWLPRFLRHQRFALDLGLLLDFLLCLGVYVTLRRWVFRARPRPSDN